MAKHNNTLEVDEGEVAIAMADLAKSSSVRWTLHLHTSYQVQYLCDRVCASKTVAYLTFHCTRPYTRDKWFNIWAILGELKESQKHNIRPSRAGL